MAFLRELMADREIEKPKDKTKNKNSVLSKLQEINESLKLSPMAALRRKRENNLKVSKGLETKKLKKTKKTNVESTSSSMNDSSNNYSNTNSGFFFSSLLLNSPSLSFPTNSSTSTQSEINSNDAVPNIGPSGLPVSLPLPSDGSLALDSEDFFLPPYISNQKRNSLSN
jgi:Tfp pilus assembly protein FimT